MEPSGGLTLQPEFNIQPRTVFSTTSNFEKYKQFEINLDKNKERRKSSKQPTELYYDELEHIFENLPIPEKFTKEMIVDKMREFNNSDAEKKTILSEIYDIKYNIMKYKAFIENDLLTPKKSQYLAEYLFCYYKNMYDFYSPIIKDFEIDHKNISYYFYYTDLPEKFLSTFSETYRLEEIAVKSLLSVLVKFKNEFISKTPSIFQKHDEKAFQTAVNRLTKESIKSIINSYMRVIDQIIETTGDMEYSRNQLKWLINIWNAKDINDIYQPDKISIKKIDKRIFDNYLSNLIRSNNECKKLFSLNFPRVIQKQIDEINEDTKIAWAELTRTLINSPNI